MATPTTAASSPAQAASAQGAAPNAMPSMPPMLGSSASNPITIQVASIPAAGTPDPHWTAYVQAISTPVIAVIAACITAYFAWRQWKTAHSKLNFDLFTKRYQVYDTVRRFFGSCVTRPRITDDLLTHYLENTGETRWLFDEEIEQYVRQAYQNAVDMQTAQFDRDGGDPDSLENGRKKATELLKWFNEELKDLHTRFDRHMKIQ